MRQTAPQATAFPPSSLSADPTNSDPKNAGLFSIVDKVEEYRCGFLKKYYFLVLFLCQIAGPATAASTFVWTGPSCTGTTSGGRTQTQPTRPSSLGTKVKINWPETPFMPCESLNLLSNLKALRVGYPFEFGGLRLVDSANSAMSGDSSANFDSEPFALSLGQRTLAATEGNAGLATGDR